MTIKCFMVEPTGKYKRFLRRFSSVDGGMCPGKLKYHNAMKYLDESDNGMSYCYLKEGFENADWPKKCDHCDYIFKDTDSYQIFTDEYYKNLDTGELYLSREKPPGAMWYATWLEDLEPTNGWPWRGPDGRILMCKTPGGEWNIDSRANNCTMPDDNEHRCWIREGVPPNVTAGKAGNTCKAGAGSIQCGSYHGFLRNGELT